MLMESQHHWGTDRCIDGAAVWAEVLTLWHVLHVYTHVLTHL